MTLRIGLLGASRIAPLAVIAPARDNPVFAVTAVGAREIGRAQAYAREHGVPAAADGYGALIARDDVDIVYNALPPAAHARWTIAALAAGKTVLCEKPFARGAAEARAMVAAGRAHERPLLEAFHYRWHPVFRRAEALLADGVLGALTAAEARFEVAIPHAAGELRWSAEQGGGALMDLGCYPLHALRTLLRGEPEVAAAQGRFQHGVDTAMDVDLIFPGLVRAAVGCSMTAAQPAAWLRVEGERGYLQIRNFLAPQLGCRFTTVIDGRETVHPVDGPSTYAAQLEHLRQVVEDLAAPMTGGADAIANMTLIEAIYTAARA
jgi:predicted dehydrogenase